MEVDEPGGSAPRYARDELDSPFDVEQVAAQYEGRAKAQRLVYMASQDPAIAGAALTLALRTLVSSTLDTQLYESTFHAYREHIDAVAAGQVPPPAAQAAAAWYEGASKAGLESFERSWVERTRRDAQSALERLEVELKGYTTNLIKESIRMGYRDIARQQYRMGDLPGAIRSYTKCREYCTTSQHILELSLGVIEVSLEQKNYAFVRNYVIKAESALEAIHSQSSKSAKSKTPSTNLPGMVAPAMDPAEQAKERERNVVLEKLRVANGVALLGTAGFAAAANTLCSIGPETLASGSTHIVPPGDIALYAVLTGLATFDRADVRARLLENADLRPMLDLEPYLRDVLRAFYASEFKQGLDLLNKHLTRQVLDLHLGAHVPALHALIRSRAVLSYFRPFSTISTTRMASAFGWSEESLLALVTDLIERGELDARVDAVGGVLVARVVDGRREAFRKAVGEGERLQRKTLASQLRMKLIKHDIVVKGSKSSQEAY